MSDINMTPLIDVMLVLVVIFIITAPLLTSAIRLELPKTEAAQPDTASSFVTVAVKPSGEVFLNDQPVTPAALAVRLAQTAATAPDTEVHLRADAAVPYGRVAQVMGIAQKAGLNRIGFMAEPAPAGPP